MLHKQCALPVSYHHKGFVATHALGHMMYRLWYLFVDILYDIFRQYCYMVSFCWGSWINMPLEKGSQNQGLNDAIWLLMPQSKSLTKSFVGSWHIFCIRWRKSVPFELSHIFYSSHVSLLHFTLNMSNSSLEF